MSLQASRNPLRFAQAVAGRAERMNRIEEAIRSIRGPTAVAVTGNLLYRELRGHSVDEMLTAFRAISAPCSSFPKGLPDAPPTQAIAALLTFRLLYLIAPLGVSLVVVAVFENRRIFALLRGRQHFE